ncbi:MAG TPA: hypothetical protein VK673_02385 [Chthoniobacterales bacterium]|nr:hypothetical protein [Chthoniobacterales bacterium]
MSHKSVVTGFPDGFEPMLLDLESDVAPLRIALVIRSASAPGTPLLLLRETIDASVYLGCLMDASGDPKTWLEIWVQNGDHVAQSFQAQLEGVSNSLIDQRWSARLDSFRKLDRRALIETGWETVHPPPAFIDPKLGKLIHPIDPGTNAAFVLCTRDDRLVSGGLPPYTTSLHTALATGETRIRTLPQRLPDSVMTALEQATGTPIRSVHFEILPLLASPCDMYATAVTAARVLLVHRKGERRSTHMSMPSLSAAQQNCYHSASAADAGDDAATETILRANGPA